MAGQQVDEALQALGQAIARLEAAVTAREARLTEASAEGEQDERDEQDARARTALRQEYELLRNDYHELRQVVEQVDGRLEGTVTRLRALLEG